MLLRTLVVLGLFAPASALVCRDANALTRRGLLQRSLAVGVSVGAAAPVWADTQPILSEQSAGAPSAPWLARHARTWCAVSRISVRLSCAQRA